MGYTTTITFRGLCAMVPSHEPEDTTEPSWIGMFLVNADNGARASQQINLPQHFPLIRFNLNDLEGVGNAPGNAPAPMAMQELSLEDIVFVPPPGSEEGLKFNFRKTVGSVPEDEQRLLNWLPRVDDVKANAGIINPELFEPTDSSRRVAARVHLTQGELSTATIGNIRKIPVVVKLGESGKLQAVAGSVALTIKCEDGPFRVRFKKFVGNGSRELIFKQPADGKLDLEVLNLCADELPIADNLAVRANSAPGPDTDFGWFYTLSQAQPADIGAAPVPEPDPILLQRLLATAGTGVGGGTDTARCSPPRFNAASSTSVNSMLQIVHGLSS